jgi:hypothetical protein
VTAALSIVGPIIAAAVLWVGWQQMQIARVKLQHDLFDRRFRVYEGARLFMDAAVRDSVVSDEAIKHFLNTTRDAVLLFDDDSIERHLRAIYARVCDRNAAQTRLKECPDNIRDELIEKSLQASLWLGQQSDNLALTFRPYIGLPKVKTFPWSR